MGIKAPYCKLCETSHWRYEAHDLSRVRIRNVRVERPVKALVSGSAPGQESTSVTRTRRPVQAQASKPVEVEMAVGPGKCEVCGTKIEVSAKKGPPRTLCSPKCRKAKSRRGRDGKS